MAAQRPHRDAGGMSPGRGPGRNGTPAGAAYYINPSSASGIAADAVAAAVDSAVLYVGTVPSVGGNCRFACGYYFNSSSPAPLLLQSSPGASCLIGNQ